MVLLAAALSAVATVSGIGCIGRNRLVLARSGLVETTIAELDSGVEPTLARQQWDGGKAYLLGQHTIAVPTSATEARARQLVRNVRVVLDAFEHDHGRIEQHLLIVITDKRSFELAVTEPWFLVAGIKVRHITGVCCGDTEIAVTAGELDSLPSLYHEFCHAALPDAGGSHKNPLWDQWNARGHELSEQIRSRWR